MWEERASNQERTAVFTWVGGRLLKATPGLLRPRGSASGAPEEREPGVRAQKRVAVRKPVCGGERRQGPRILLRPE